MIEIVSRTSKASVRDSLPKSLLKLQPQGSIRPELCPAIREYDQIGIFVGSPFPLNFGGATEFDVLVYRNAPAGLLLCPGVIGGPDSDLLFARIDSGLSFVNLPSSVISIAVQNIAYAHSNLCIPPTLYPRGYTGPILLAVGSNIPHAVRSGEPLVQLIALDDAGGKFSVERLDITHDSFEGLLSPWWEENVSLGECLTAHEVFNL